MTIAERVRLPKFKPLPRTQTTFLRDKVRDVVEADPAMGALRGKLLAIGGIEVVLPTIEDDLDRLLKVGNVIRGRVLLRLGQPSQCHSNTAWLWNAARSVRKIATGYALSADGLWRPHSWVVERTPRMLRARILETTRRRLCYWGFVLSRAEHTEFFFNNGLTGG